MNHNQSHRQLLREFLVIVGGVSVALAADAFRDQRHDRALEREYLSQLRAELGENATRLNAAIALEGTARHETILRDSAETWVNTRRAVYYSDPRLLLGTATVLISTGELGIITDVKLRRGIAGYVTEIQEDRQEFDRAVNSLIDYFKSLQEQGFSGEAEVDIESGRFAAVVVALTGRPGRKALQALDGVISSNDIRVTYLKRMLDSNEKLARLIQPRK